MSALINPFVFAPGIWATAYTRSLVLDGTGWSGFNLRIVVPSSVLAAVNGSKVRLTLTPASTAGFSVDGLYAGHAAGAGDAYDFDGTQVQFKVGGSGSFSVAALNPIVTDPSNYAFDHTKAYVIAVHFNATSAVRAGGVAPLATYYKSAANETSVSNVSTYATAASPHYLVSTIEVLTLP